MTKGRIFAYRRDRLGGRLRSMVNAMRLADWSGADLTVLWPVGHYAQELANPDEFFDSDYVTDYIELDEDHIRSAYEGTPHIGDFETLEALRVYLHSGEDVVIENSKAALVLPGESDEEGNLAFIETAKRITPAPEVREALARFDAMVDGRTATALHVRRGDIIQAGRWSRTYWPTKYVPDEYYDVMIEADTEAAFLLFSDTPQSLERFELVHGIRSAISVMNLEKLTDSQRDFAELLAISRCDKVIAASDSAFSTAATLLGGTTKQSLPEDMSKPMRVEAEQRLINRVETGPQAFLNVYDYGQCARRVVELHQMNKETGKANAIMAHVVDQGWELPHLTRHYLGSAVRADDHTAVLKMLAAEQTVRKLRRWHFDSPGLLKHHIRRQILSGFAYAGLGNNDLAAQCFSNLALSQTTICPLDIISSRLRDYFLNGWSNVPPTTEVPFFEDQVHPNGLSSTAEYSDHFCERFLGDSSAWNWQTAFDLDWRSIGVNERPLPRQERVRHIIQTGKASDDPMLKSLAAIGLLRVGRKQRARVVMDVAESAEPPKTALNKAILAKRRAQIDEALGDDQTAEEAMLTMLSHSRHPAFIAYYLHFLTRKSRRFEAREIILEISDLPFYLSWLQYELLARGEQGADNREELRQECLDHLEIVVPDHVADQKVAS
ncbi:MAG: hypothetical protein P8Q23_08895 [Paracoccaceae bacterium]|nr:hypothetical protein [Paracoccaceae bacterium]